MSSSEILGAARDAARPSRTARIWYFSLVAPASAWTTVGPLWAPYLDPLDAYQLVTQAVESPLANVCDPNYTSVAKIAKDYLPAAGAMNGDHARLTAIADSYRGS